MEDYKIKIVERIKNEGQILDVSLAPYFDMPQWLFHDKVKSSKYSDKYKFWGIVKGINEYAEFDYGANPYNNMGLSIIRPETEACMLTKKDIIDDLENIFPQHKKEIEELKDLIID